MIPNKSSPQIPMLPERVISNAIGEFRKAECLPHCAVAVFGSASFIAAPEYKRIKSMTKQQPWLISRNAYSIFLEEIGETVHDARRFLAQAGNLSDAEMVKQMRVAMHKVKGSAGFFGVDGLAKIAAQFESHLRMDSPPLSDRLPALAELMQALEAAASDLPTPPDDQQND